jgi:hypothetical protein
LRALGFWLVFLLGDADILHITASEDNVFVDTRGRREFFARVASTPFCAVGHDIFKGDRRSFGVDLV